MTAHQARISTSRRTDGFRPAALNAPPGQLGHDTEDRALLFTPRESVESGREPGIMEQLTDPTSDEGQLFDQLEPEERLSCSRSQVASPDGLRASLASTLRSALQPGKGGLKDLPTDSHIAGKLAASGSKQMSKEELVKRFGARKTARILAGKLAVEDGKVYDVSLIKACLLSQIGDVINGAAVVMIACKSIISS